jgi:NAD(P)-dependent dehydrogenase (short-subunit alcohol dehydrogenase family)
MASTTSAPAILEKLFSVSGKNVLVTGGSRGIGLMISKAFADAGANVLLTSRDENACSAAAEAIHAKYVTSTLSSREGCEKLAEYTSNHFQGRLDVLVNNAGTSWGEPLDRNSRTGWGWDKVFDLNVKGMFYLTLACRDLLKRPNNDDPGRVINIGSVAGMIPQQAPTHAYDVSKAAVHHLTKKLASDFAKDNITVNCLAPGFVQTRMSQGLAAWGGDAETLAKSTPLRRLGNADDMAGACLYLSSRASAWCTGVILNVDGGAVGAIQLPLSSL